MIKGVSLFNEFGRESVTAQQYICANDFTEILANLQKCNMNLEPKTAKFDNYEIKLGEVTPYPANNIRIDASKHTAQIIITKM